MEPEQYLAAIARDTELLVDAATRAGLDAPVPSCPGWTVSYLLAHVGQVYRWVADNTRWPADATSPADLVDPPPGSERAQWVRDGAAGLLVALDRSPDDPAWTLGPPATVGYWQRRQAFETVMHRVDAELATDASVTPIESAFAVDGIDERLERLAFRPRRTIGSGETIHLHCTDMAGEWLITLTPEGMEVVAEHAKADVAARGTADDLLCWLYARRPIDAIEVLGEQEVLERFRDQSNVQRKASTSPA